MLKKQTSWIRNYFFLPIQPLSLANYSDEEQDDQVVFKRGGAQKEAMDDHGMLASPEYVALIRSCGHSELTHEEQAFWIFQLGSDSILLYKSS